MTPTVTEPMQNEFFRYRMDDPKDIWFTSEPLMLDIETHGDDYTNIRTVQLFQTSWACAIIIDTNDYSASYILDYIKDKHVVIHNATFEIYCFMNDCNLSSNPFTNWSDTFLLARRAYFNQIEAFGLDSVAAYAHGMDYYKYYAKKIGHTNEEDIKAYKKSMQKSFLDSPKSDKRAEPLYYEQLHYAALDVLLMPKIYRSIKEVEDEFIIQLDYKFIPWAVKYSQYGLIVDIEKDELAILNATGLVDEAVSELPPSLNVNSWVQVRKLFSSEASDDTFLAGIENEAIRDPEDPIKEERASWAKNIRKQRKFIKQRTFAITYLKDRVFGYTSPRTISGRIATDTINLLQIPRALKGVFGYTEEDNRYMVYADFSNLELRMTAAVLNELTMVEKFKNGEDLHVFSGSKIYNKPVEDVSKAERFIGKFFNFSAAYGAGPARLCGMLMKEAGIYMTEEEMRPKLRVWKNTWPGIKAWHNTNGRSKTNEDITLSGRRYKAKMYTDLNAIKMQGSAAEVFKLASLYLVKNLPKVKLMNGIHDSYLIETDSIEQGIREAGILAKCMVTAWFEITKQAEVPDLPMPTTALVGKNWGDIEEDIYQTSIELDGEYESHLEYRDAVIAGTL